MEDAEIVRRVRAGEPALFEVLMRRHNQRVYRTVRAVLRDLGDPEDVMQQAYVNAYTHLHQFEERAQFSTWLTRITVNEALAQRRALRRHTPMTERRGEQDDSEESMETLRTTDADPERQAYSRELSDLLEEAVDNLPDTYRVVFMLRDVEGMSTRETSEGLGLGEEAVKTRLHRARADSAENHRASGRRRCKVVPIPREPLRPRCGWRHGSYLGTREISSTAWEFHPHC